ncbi:hypothetical protein PspLS_02972 [Pyricularia sp. CBS 133598]|nr:hypothetical protein PspLS_02972 [Pyricularia sp. CBS 133598]
MSATWLTSMYSLDKESIGNITFPSRDLTFDVLDGATEPKQSNAHILDPILTALELVAQAEERSIVCVDELEKLRRDCGAPFPQVRPQIFQSLVPVC